ncbi:MAG: glutamate racemase [Cyanobacteria bacterium P01_G01_bin.39]
MKNLHQRIGLFDSGVGGLTVLREMYRQMPTESLLYFADSARLPYGTRSPEEILRFVREILDWLCTQDVKMIIMACNTSSALALETVRQEYDIPILGVILAGARAAVKQGQRIGVIATEATTKSHAYRQAIQEINPQTQVWEIPCPEFVRLIEQNQLHTETTKQVAQQYLAPLLEAQIDTLIYGCTHYRHLDQTIRHLLPNSVQIIDPAEHIVVAAETELSLLGLRNNQFSLPTNYYVSGAPQKFASLSQQWLGYSPHVIQVPLKELSSVMMSLNEGS